MHCTGCFPAGISPDLTFLSSCFFLSFVLTLISLASQILYTHQKSFTAEHFQAIKSIFVSSQARMTVLFASPVTFNWLDVLSTTLEVSSCMSVCSRAGFLAIFIVPLQEDGVQILSSLIFSSSHRGLQEIVQSFVVPVLRLLYIHSPATGDYAFTSCHIAKIHVLLN